MPSLSGMPTADYWIRHHCSAILHARKTPHLACQGVEEGVEASAVLLQRRPWAAARCLGQRPPPFLVPEVAAWGPWAKPSAHWGAQGVLVVVAVEVQLSSDLEALYPG